MNSNQYKMIVSDYDRTLTNRDNKVSKQNIEAIKSFIGKGGVFAVATGRSSLSIKPILKVLGLDNIPVISSQGALIEDERDCIIYKKHLDISYLKEAIHIIESYKIYYHIETLTNIISEKKTLISNMYIKRSGLKKHVIYTRNLLEYLNKNPDLEVFKISLLCKKKNVFKIQEELNEKLAGKIEFVHAGFILLEATAPQANKGNAVHFLADRVGIKPEEVIVTGDSMNDYSMINNDFLSIAVKNAHSKILEKAKHITSSCDEHAIASIIKEFII